MFESICENKTKEFLFIWFEPTISGILLTTGPQNQCDQILSLWWNHRCLIHFWMFISYWAQLWTYFGKYFLLLGKLSLIQMPKYCSKNLPVWSHCCTEQHTLTDDVIFSEPHTEQKTFETPYATVKTFKGGYSSDDKDAHLRPPPTFNYELIDDEDGEGKFEGPHPDQDGEKFRKNPSRNGREVDNSFSWRFSCRRVLWRLFMSSLSWLLWLFSSALSVISVTRFG